MSQAKVSPTLQPFLSSDKLAESSSCVDRTNDNKAESEWSLVPRVGLAQCPGKPANV